MIGPQHKVKPWPFPGEGQRPCFQKASEVEKVKGSIMKKRPFLHAFRISFFGVSQAHKMIDVHIRHLRTMTKHFDALHGRWGK